MYQLDRKSHKHVKMRKRLTWLLVFILIFATIYGISHLTLTPKQELRSSPQLSRKSTLPNQTKQLIKKPEFTMSLASTWKEDAIERTSTAPTYSYTDSSNARIIKLYLDNPPTNLGVNRAIVVSGDADKLTYGSVSENCITYTEASRANTQSGLANAKWQEVDFLCDMANHARAVVGTISKDGINQVHVRTGSGVMRKVFITYTDNNINPDYSVLYDMLQSLQFL